MQSRIPIGEDGLPIVNPNQDSEEDTVYRVDPFGPIPAYKNWMDEGYVTRPYDQGACGACWAFTAASTLESLAMITGTEPSSSLQEYSV